MLSALFLPRNDDIMIPEIIFHVSYPFHKWFLYYKGDFDPHFLDNLRKKVITFEKLWTAHEKKVLTLLPSYVGVGWPYTEIHVYCFENAEYYDVPCISDPVSINMTGDNLELFLLYLIHELVHVIIQFDSRFSRLSLNSQEAVAYFVGNKVLEDIMEDPHPVIDLFTVFWPYNFVEMAAKFKDKVNLTGTTVLELIERGIL